MGMMMMIRDQHKVDSERKGTTMTNPPTKRATAATISTGTDAKAALATIRNILNAKSWTDDGNGYGLIHSPGVDEAQAFIRDHLEAPYFADKDIADELRAYPDNYPGLTIELANRIMTDLNTIWAYPYYRDEISTIAMELSLCPMHFGDWAGCFDDENPECEQIRAIFPHSHDT